MDKDVLPPELQVSRAGLRAQDVMLWQPRSAATLPLQQLRYELVEAQRRLREAGIPFLILLAGADGVKSDTVNALSAWLDPRGIDATAFGHALKPDPERPRFAPYFDAIPAAGRIGLLCGSWYTPLVQGRIDRTLTRKHLRFELDRVVFFERMLAEGGLAIVKIWLHLDEAAQRQRLKKLSENPLTRWKVSPEDWRRLDHHARSRPLMKQVLEATHAQHAPWHVIDAADDERRNALVGQIALDAMQGALATPGGAVRSPVVLGGASERLATVDLERRLPVNEYEQRLPGLQAQLRALGRAAFEQGRSAVLVFEGWDAAGKGGTIQRLTQALDARQFRVVPTGPPSVEERAHHYLWRFWRNVPRDGRIAIYDRSWYGRVLVERVEGFASTPEWQGAYEEINEFELHLISHGTPVFKFWLHLSPEEQLRRFHERQVTPWKQHKITEEDWRNRERWDDYLAAVDDMLAFTDRSVAPWHVIPANDKRYARVAVLEEVCNGLGAVLETAKARTTRHKA